MATKALSLLCISSLLLAISGSITTAQARSTPDGVVPILLDMVDEELSVIRSHISPPAKPDPKVPARDSNGPMLPKPPALKQLLLEE